MRRHLLTSLVAAVICLYTPHRGAAQTLRLDDIFGAPGKDGSAVTLSDLQSNPARAKQLLESARQSVESGKFADVLSTTELLTAWLPPDSEDYATCLWYRAHAYEGLKEWDKLVAVSDLYLKSFPQAKQRGWFLIRVADEAQRQGKSKDAVTLWKMALAEKTPLAPAESLRAAELLNAGGEGISARAALKAATAEPAREDELRRASLLTESLLLADDPQTEIPAAVTVTDKRTASYTFRRALLMEIRGQKEQAAQEYLFLNGRRQLLDPPERLLLADRLAMQATDFWPPRKSPAQTPAVPNGKSPAK